MPVRLFIILSTKAPTLPRKKIIEIMRLKMIDFLGRTYIYYYNSYFIGKASGKTVSLEFLELRPLLIVQESQRLRVRLYEIKKSLPFYRYQAEQSPVPLFLKYHLEEGFKYFKIEVEPNWAKGQSL